MHFSNCEWRLSLPYVSHVHSTRKLWAHTRASVTRGSYCPRLRPEHYCSTHFLGFQLPFVMNALYHAFNLFYSHLCSLSLNIASNVLCLIFARVFHQQALEIFPNLAFFTHFVLPSQANNASDIVQVTISNQAKTRSMASNEDWTNALHRHPQINSTKSHMASTTIGK